MIAVGNLSRREISTPHSGCYNYTGQGAVRNRVTCRSSPARLYERARLGRRNIFHSSTWLDRAHASLPATASTCFNYHSHSFAHQAPADAVGHPIRSWSASTVKQPWSTESFDSAHRIGTRVRTHSAPAANVFKELHAPSTTDSTAIVRCPLYAVRFATYL